MLRRAILMSLAIAAALAVGAPAAASLSDDVIPGRALAEQLKTGTTTCADLSTGDFQHIGEYVISRMTGSAQLHAAMSDRMRSVMGSANTERMRTLMGQRYAGCTVRGNVGPMMGPTMMGRGWADDGTWGPMMNSEAWNWMRDGNWQRMSQADWQRVADEWMGPGMMRVSDDRWDTSDAVLVGIGLLLVAALLGSLVAWKPWRYKRPGAVAQWPAQRTRPPTGQSPPGRGTKRPTRSA
jgi:hypothetical protein